MGKSYFVHIPDSRVAAATERSIAATTQYSRAEETDVMIMCLPTPLNRDRQPDLSFFIGSLAGILPFLHPGQLICLESTTYPGTTEEEIKPRIESKGLKVRGDVFLVFSPEREDPGNAQCEIPQRSSAARHRRVLKWGQRCMGRSLSKSCR